MQVDEIEMKLDQFIEIYMIDRKRLDEVKKQPQPQQAIAGSGSRTIAIGQHEDDCD